MTTNWYGLYGEKWGKDLIVPAAIAHPAKFSHGLIRQIYKHALAMGYILPGQAVLDPFGGVALGSLYAMQNGLNWLGVELEENFCTLGNQNIAMWNDRFASHFPRWGQARLIQGDSRFLSRILVEQAGMIVSSPPYDEGLGHKVKKVRDIDIEKGLLSLAQADYGSTPGQLGNLPSGDLDSLISGQRDNITESHCFIYLLFSNPDNGISLLLQVPILPRVLIGLSGQGVPIFSIGFNDEIEVRQKEVAMIIRDLKLKDVTNTLDIQEGCELDFELGLFSLPITPYTAIDTSTLLSAIEVYGKDTFAGRALFFDFSRSTDSGAFIGTVLTNSVSDLGLEDKELLAALFAGSKDRSKRSPISARPGAIYTTAFGVYGRDSKYLSALLASKRHLESCSVDNSASFGATFTFPIFDFTDGLIENTLADNAGTIRDDTIEILTRVSPLPKETVASGGTKVLVTSFDVFRESGKFGITIKARNLNFNQDTPLSNLPSITARFGISSKADTVISSSPFAGNSGGRGEASRNGIDAALFDRHSGGMKKGTGDDPANLDHLSMGGFEAVISSSPFENSGATLNVEGKCRQVTAERAERKADKVYGVTPNQLGNDSGDSFWSAAKLIIQECYTLLKPQAYAIWVTKQYVKSGRVVDFPQQWLTLCEACGFTHVETILAWQTKQQPGQQDMDGKVHSKLIRNQSFFRILAIKNNPATAIDYEVVLVVRKI